MTFGPCITAADDVISSLTWMLHTKVYTTYQTLFYSISVYLTHNNSNNNNDMLQHSFPLTPPTTTTARFFISFFHIFLLVRRRNNISKNFPIIKPVFNKGALFVIFQGPLERTIKICHYIYGVQKIQWKEFVEDWDLMKGCMKKEANSFW